MEEKKVNFTLGASAGPGVPVKDKKPAEIVPAKTTAVATVPEKALAKAEKPKKATGKPKKTASKTAKKASETKEKKTTVDVKKTAKNADKETTAVTKKPGRPKKTEAAKKPGRKATAETKAAPVKKTTTRAKKAVTTAKKTATKSPKNLKTSVILQFADKNVSYDTIVDNAKNNWAADRGKKGTVKTLDVYVKPEDGKAYYVVNGKDMGDFAL